MEIVLPFSTGGKWWWLRRLNNLAMRFPESSAMIRHCNLPYWRRGISSKEILGKYNPQTSNNVEDIVILLIGSPHRVWEFYGKVTVCTEYNSDKDEFDSLNYQISRLNNKQPRVAYSLVIRCFIWRSKRNFSADLARQGASFYNSAH